MNFRRVSAVTRKEFLHVLRDARSLGMAIAVPLILLLLFGYALTLDVDHVPMLVWDQSGTPASRELASRFAGSPYFSLRGGLDNGRELDRAIDTRDVLMVLVIPYDFARRLAAGREAPVQLIVAGMDSNTATIAIAYADAVADGFSQDQTVRQLRERGLTDVRIPLEVRSRVWFNADLESRNYIVPGLIAVIMMVIAAMLTSLCFAREWERGTMEQLIATPVRGSELILGKLIPYFTIGMLDMLLAVLLGQFLFHVPLRGNVALLFALASVFLLGVLTMGITISIITKAQVVACQMAMTLTFLPSFLLSGFIFAIVNMPRPIQWITRVVPARYFITILKGIYLKGVGLEILAADAALLVVFAAVMLALAGWKFKKKLT
ncbi:MAG: ABC transporter permease [Thermoguttaceae bacterium]|jgi:ABC-2 type transport system permease protein